MSFQADLEDFLSGCFYEDKKDQDERDAISGLLSYWKKCDEANEIVMVLPKHSCTHEDVELFYVFGSSEGKTYDMTLTGLRRGFDSANDDLA